MRLIASPEAVRHVHERGGKLYVWAKQTRCCGGSLTFLETATEQPARSFRRVPADELELWVAFPSLPEELHLDMRRRGVRAYWNGCAYVV